MVKLSRREVGKDFCIYLYYIFKIINLNLKKIYLTRTMSEYQLYTQKTMRKDVLYAYYILWKKSLFDLTKLFCSITKVFGLVKK